jgi:DNA repair photolyase
VNAQREAVASPREQAAASPAPDGIRSPWRVGPPLRRLEVGQGHPVWSLEPYAGCELGCTFCPVREGATTQEAWLDFERHVAARPAVVGALRAALGPGTAGPRRVVLGAGSEPWQPAEERHRLTRHLLETLQQLEPLDLQVHTRSSLIARDTDVLRALSQRGRVTVAFSLASLDERLNRLLEPRAPSALRRLMAVEALARAGLLVGVRLSPVLPTVEVAELEALLTRAANAGARFAELGFLSSAPAEQARSLQRVVLASPDVALRYRRVLQRAAQVPPGTLHALREAFTQRCERLGLVALLEGGDAGSGAGEGTRLPTQLSLFPTH